jgi:hypothetical protein
MTPYADPRPVRDIASCYFYHRVELPGVGVVGGAWDLRETIDDYLAGFRFAGKRVLDVGAASGFPSFEMEMERRGAEVVSFDMSPDGRWDIVPLAGMDVNAAAQHKLEALRAAARRTRDVLIVTEPAYRAAGPEMEFMPTRSGPVDTWWRLSEGCVAQMMDVLGFDVERITHSRHTLTLEPKARSFEFFSVGRRTVTGG